MLKLIKTNLKMFTFELEFILALAACCGTCLFLVSNTYAISSSTGQLLTGLPFVCAAVIFNVGRDNLSGAVKNKLIAGYTRKQVFLSNVITSMICSVILFIVTAIPCFAMIYIEINEDPRLHIGVGRLLFIAFILMMTYILAAALCAVLATCITRITVVIAAVLALVAVLSPLHFDLEHLLDSPKYFITGDYKSVSDAPAGSVQLIKNSDYISQPLRGILRTISYCNPVTQYEYISKTIGIFSDDELVSRYEKKTILGFDDTPAQDWELECQPLYYASYRDYCFFPLYSAGFAAVIIIVGLRLYKKKNIN